MKIKYILHWLAFIVVALLTVVFFTGAVAVIGFLVYQVRINFSEWWPPMGIITIVLLFYWSGLYLEKHGLPWGPKK